MVLLAYYSVGIVLMSVLGGLIPDWVRLTHRRTELAVSFVAGTMLGVAMLQLLPHALAGVPPTDGAAMGVGGSQYAPTLYWVTFGFLAMFFIERFFCFHHHEAAPDHDEHGGGAHDEHSHAGHDHHCGAHHDHGNHATSDHTAGLTWSGAAMGLTLHSMLGGVALGASVLHAPPGTWLAGFGAFLATALHKPLDAMTIAVLMERGGWSALARCVVNGLFALAVPLGMVVFYVGMAPLGDERADGALALAMAFSAGVFLCVSLSDLLPELHFHHHDRLKLSLALLAGLAVADVAGRFEAHTHAPPAATPSGDAPSAVD
ncbi:MAG: ZIP family metal transporter [Lacipirellulaceae bacterium]